MRGMTAVKTAAIGAVVVAALVVGGSPAALGQTSQTGGVDWTKVMNALSNALKTWRLSPFPQQAATATPIATRTPTAAPSTATATRTLTPSRTASTTRMGTVTATRTITRIATSTRTPSRTTTSTRTATATHPPTTTPSPRPTSTPFPTVSSGGQIAFDVAAGVPPAQKLASAFVVFPYLVTTAPKDTRIELMNMSSQPVQLQCFYVRQTDCVEIGFFVTLSGNQPLSWSAHDGTFNPLTFTAVPPLDTFGGIGELKCAVATDLPDLSAHNVLQGRAIVVDTVSGATVGYGAVGFQRLSPGSYTGEVDLDGFTYESCPDRLHFQVLTTQSGGPISTLITVPCAEDLLNQTPTQSVVQLAIVNEFEQVFSSSYHLACFSSLSFSALSTLSHSVTGSDSAHLIVRGVSSPLIGLVIDRFSGQNNTVHTTANEPFLEGGRTSTVIFP
jgi:hypothetical protein